MGVQNIFSDPKLVANIFASALEGKSKAEAKAAKISGRLGKAKWGVGAAGGIAGGLGGYALGSYLGKKKSRAKRNLLRALLTAGGSGLGAAAGFTPLHLYQRKMKPKSIADALKNIKAEDIDASVSSFVEMLTSKGYDFTQ